MNISNAILSDERQLFVASPIQKSVVPTSGASQHRTMQSHLSASDDEEDSTSEGSISTDDEDDDEENLVYYPSSGGQEDDPIYTDAPPSPQMRPVRLPSTFSHALVLDRRVSSTSQRSQQHDQVQASALKVDVALDGWSDNDTMITMQPRARSSSASAQLHMSAVRSGKTRPTPMQIDVSHHTALAPRIEIEQVFDDEQGGEEVMREQVQLDGLHSARNVARTHMMQTIVGRKRVATLRRSESMEEVTTSSNDSPSHSGLLSASLTTPSPRSPGTASFSASHQRSLSCPTPNSPQLLQFGSVQVTITPPTPRPQGSPILGVFIRGVHRTPVTNRTPSTHFCTVNAQTVSSPSTCCTRAAAASLLPPAFEMAPGRTKLMEAQRVQAMAMIAWQHRQQQSFLQQTWSNSMLLQPQQRYGDDDSPKISPGTPGAPSMVHVQEMRAMQQRHRQSKQQQQQATKKVLLHAPSSASMVATSASQVATSWWREPRSAPTVWSGSSASAYQGMGSGTTTITTMDASLGATYDAAAPSSPPATASAADRATSWRRRDSVDETSSGGDSDSDDSCRARVRATPPPPLQSYAMRRGGSGSKSSIGVRAYVPPAKRVTFAKQEHPRNQGVMGRKEGVAAAAMAKSRCLAPATTTAQAPAQDVSVRSRAAQSMLARISSRTTANTAVVEA